MLKIQSGVLYPSSSTRAVSCREGTAGSDAGAGVMGSVSCGFNREKKKRRIAVMAAKGGILK